MRGARLVAAAGFVALVALHHDFWREPRARLWLGWLPEEVVWRLGFVALSALYLAFVCRYVWEDPEEEP